MAGIFFLAVACVVLIAVLIVLDGDRPFRRRR